MKKLDFIARTLRGIETIAASEIQQIFQINKTKIEHREVWFSTSLEDPANFSLQSADDLFFLMKQIRSVDHTRNSITYIQEAFSDSNPNHFIELIKTFRKLPKKPRFTVVASFLGKRNYNRFEIEDGIGERIEQQISGTYQSSKLGKESPPDLTFRVHLWNDRGWLGLRIFDIPLHRRPYKITSRSGSLHPPLAYSMAILADIQENHTVIDPFCGVGTIPIEAKRNCPEAKVIGLDFELLQTQQAKENADHANLDISFQESDAGSLPFEDQSIDRIVSNIPWNHQVDAAGTLQSGLMPFWLEMKRVLTNDGKAILLTHEQDDQVSIIEELGFRVKQLEPLSLFGKHPRIWVIDFLTHRIIEHID